MSIINPELVIPAAVAKRSVVAKADRGPVSYWELGGLASLFVVYLVTIGLVGDQGTFIINVGGPAVMGVILLMGVVPAVIRDIDLIWTPLFWFRLATVVYFSVGNVLTYFLNPASQRQIENFFAQYADFIGLFDIALHHRLRLFRIKVLQKLRHIEVELFRPGNNVFP